MSETDSEMDSSGLDEDSQAEVLYRGSRSRERPSSPRGSENVRHSDATVRHAGDERMGDTREPVVFQDGHESDSQIEDIHSEDDSDLRDTSIGSGVANEYRASILRELVGEERSLSSGTNLIEVVQRLVGNIDSTPFGRQSSEMDGLLENLVQREDPFIIMESLNELSERLLMMNGITAERIVPSNRLAKALVDILRDPGLQDHLELHLVACRCLFNFVEVNQDFIHDALANGAIEILVRLISEISFIDLTEQALQTLEMMSRETASHNSIITSDGLAACLKNIDFLTLHAQRKCLTVISNSCLQLRENNFVKVQNIMTNLVDVVEQRNDTLICDNACLALSRIAVSFRTRVDYLEALFGEQRILALLIKTVRDALRNGSKDTTVSHRTGLSLMHSLRLLSTTSITISEFLLNCDVGGYLCSALEKNDKHDNLKSSPSSEAYDGIDRLSERLAIDVLMATPKEVVSSMLNLICSILPVNYEVSESPFSSVMNKEYFLSRMQHNKERVERYRIKNTHVEKLISRSWPILLNAYLASMDTETRKLALLCIYRIVRYLEAEIQIIRVYAREFVNILASVINKGKSEMAQSQVDVTSSACSPNDTLMSASLCIIGCMAKKEFSTCLKLAQKEGIFYEIEQMLTQEVKAFGARKPASNLGLESNMSINISRAPDSSFSDHELLHIRDLVPKELVMRKIVLSLEAIQESAHVKGGVLDLGVSSSELLRHCIERAHKSTTEYENLWAQLHESLSSGHSSISSSELVASGFLEFMLEKFVRPGRTNALETDIGRSFISNVLEDTDVSGKLVELLLDSLSRIESFDVISASDKMSSGDPAHVASLTRQIGLKIIPHRTNDEDLPVLVHVQAIATFRSVESYMKRRKLMRSKFEYAEPLNKPPAEPSAFRFYLNGEHIPTDTTVFGAIFASVQSTSRNKFSASDMWAKTHIVSAEEISLPEPLQADKRDAILEPVPVAGGAVDPILDLLKYLHCLNAMMRERGLACLPEEAFRSWKLTVKLRRQLEEILVIASGAHPSWSLALTQNYPFLFPLESRMLFLQSTSFGYSRLIHHWQVKLEGDLQLSSQNNQASFGVDRRLSVGRICRQKVRISRANLLQSALKVLELFGASPGILEIEYFDEVGTGLGPTLEFFSNVSCEFKKRRLRIWRDASFINSNSKYVESSTGLFPRPVFEHHETPSEIDKTMRIFFCLGQFLARSLFDSRIVDIDLHPLFFKIIRLRNKNSQTCWQDVLTLENLWSVDNELCRSLRRVIELSSSSKDQATDPVEALELYFVLPGAIEYELCQDGARRKVTRTNAAEFVQLVVEATLKDGVFRQIESFANGFSTVFPVRSLKVFYPTELKEIFGDKEEDWSAQTLSKAIRANHGYSQSSPTISRLITILSSFDSIQRRQFLQFLTGSPRLPVGGFKNLQPELTVVKRSPENNLSSDQYLPSVMTCASYLKLPEYSSLEVMRSRLLQAITEGANSFHLS